MARHLVFYLLLAAVLGAVVVVLGTLVGGAASARVRPHPGVLRVLLPAGAAAWAWHYAEMWRPVSWEYAASRLTAWPGGLAFAVAAPALALAAYGLAWRLAPRRPLLAALVPLGWCLAYRWHLVQLLRWRAPGEFFRIDDGHVGAWLFLLTLVLTGCLVVYAALLHVRGRAAAPRTAA